MSVHDCMQITDEALFCVCVILNVKVKLVTRMTLTNNSQCLDEHVITMRQFSLFVALCCSKMFGSRLAWLSA